MPLERLLFAKLQAGLARGKSILLLGPRQVGKTTLIKSLKYDAYLNLLDIELRQRYEKTPEQFKHDILSISKKFANMPLILVDEIQKIPLLLDTIQLMIDQKIAQFILTGSSARSLRKQGANLLPGRVLLCRLDPLLYGEYQNVDFTLENLLDYGSLPHIFTEANLNNREEDLKSYVQTYLEEEVRQEALVRSLGSFSRFLELAASEAGNISNFNKLSQAIGVAHTTIRAYYEILEDCLIAERIDPYVKGTRTKLSRSSKHLFFDLGVRRLAAQEGSNPAREKLGQLFESFVGLELIRLIRLYDRPCKLSFWRDANGIEVDWLLVFADKLIPVEVKLQAQPTIKEARHLQTFLKEYPQAKQAYIISTTSQTYELAANIAVISWKDLPVLLR